MKEQLHTQNYAAAVTIRINLDKQLKLSTLNSTKKDIPRIRHVSLVQDREIFSSHVPENLAPSSLSVSVHARKRFPDLALGAMTNPLYPTTWVGRYVHIFFKVMPF